MSGITEQVKSFIESQAAGHGFMTGDVAKTLGLASKDVSSVLRKFVSRGILLAENAVVGRSIIYVVPGQAAVEIPQEVETPEVEAQSNSETEVQTVEESDVIAISDVLGYTSESDDTVSEENEMSDDAEETESVEISTVKTEAELYFDQVMAEKFSSTRRIRAFLLMQSPETFLTSHEVMNIIGSTNIDDVASIMSTLAKQGYMTTSPRLEPKARGFRYQIVPEKILELKNRKPRGVPVKESKAAEPSSRDEALATAIEKFGKDAKEGQDFFIVPSAKNNSFSVMSAVDYKAIFAL